MSLWWRSFCGGRAVRPPRLVVDPAVTDFYQFTRDSFRLEGYEPLPFDGKIPVAI